MTDREKVIREIEDALSDDMAKAGCIYGLSLMRLKDKALTDVLALLKEQEAQTVIVDRHKVLFDDAYDEAQYIEDVFYRCPSCNQTLSRTHKKQRIRFCDECGQKVKWDG